MCMHTHHRGLRQRYLAHCVSTANVDTISAQLVSTSGQSYTTKTTFEHRNNSFGSMITYLRPILAIPHFHAQDFGRERLGLFLGVMLTYGGEDQDTSRDGADQLTIYRHRGRVHTRMAFMRGLECCGGSGGGFAYLPNVYRSMKCCDVSREGRDGGV
jgi:hypothetical protein